MTGAVVVFPDPQLSVRDLLRALLSDRAEPELDGVTVSTRDLPGADESRQLPYIRVQSDGSFRDARLNGRATIRVTVWHRDTGLALSLAGLLEALLLSASSSPIRGFSAVSGPIPTDDEETGLPLTFFTITARLRPHTLI